MTTRKYPHPLQYLNVVERWLVGWLVSRIFATNTPRFARLVQNSGPCAATHFAAAQAFTIYIWVLGMSGVFFGLVDIGVVADILYIVAGICVIWGFVCVLAGLRPQREYRQTHKARSG